MISKRLYFHSASQNPEPALFGNVDNRPNPQYMRANSSGQIAPGNLSFIALIRGNRWQPYAAPSTSLPKTHQGPEKWQRF